MSKAINYRYGRVGSSLVKGALKIGNLALSSTFGLAPGASSAIDRGFMTAYEKLYPDKQYKYSFAKENMYGRRVSRISRRVVRRPVRRAVRRVRYAPRRRQPLSFRRRRRN